MAAAAAAASSASGSASSAPAAATEVPDVIVTVTGKDGFSTKASLNLLRKYLKLVKEIPDFGEDDEPDEDTELPLSHDGVVITHVLDFAKQFDAAGFVAHKPIKKDSLKSQGVAEWAVEWAAKLDLREKFSLMAAANELLFDELVSFLAATIAHYIQSLPDAVKSATFGLSRPFTPEEEAKVRSENPWAEEE